MTINLMLRARFKSWCHGLRHTFSLNPPHLIWRHSRGLETLQIWCSCGKEFK